MKRFFISMLIPVVLALITYIVVSNILSKRVQLPIVRETKQENKIKLIEDNDIKNSIFKDNYKEAQKIVSKMTLEEKVGQLFLVRYNKNDVEYLSNFNIGGYILFAKDFDGHTKESMKKEIDHDQELNKYPLIMGVDEEGGSVTRISRFKEFRNEKFLSPRDYYQEGGWDLLEKTENEKAKLLKSIGINFAEFLVIMSSRKGVFLVTIVVNILTVHFNLKFRDVVFVLLNKITS